MTTTLAFPTLLETFFTDRLVRQKRASPHTIASYRDTFSLLLRFMQQRLGKAPSALALDDLDAPCISAFLDDLEHTRGTSARSRNVRLAAIHSFFQYAALRAPSHSGVIQRVLAIPSKRYDRTPIDFLTGAEIDVLLAVPDQHTWAGRRDRTLMLVAVQTGLRVSELTGLCWQDVIFGTGAHVSCEGKGRKTQGHLVFQYNPDESQRLCRLGRQPATCRRDIRMARPPQQPNRGVTERRHDLGDAATADL